MFLSLIILLIMGIGSGAMLYEQSQTMRKAAEARGLAFSRALALMGALVVTDKLFRIQEEINQYSQDPDIVEIDVIDHDDMIVAAKHLERIGTVLGDEEWPARMKGRTELFTYGRDAHGDPILVVVEPLVVNEEILARIRTIFSLANVRREEWQFFRRMVLVTLALIGSGIIGIQAAQRHVSRVFHGIISRLCDALATIERTDGSQRSGRGPQTIVSLIPSPPEGQGELEHLTEVVTTTTDLLKRQSCAVRESRELLQAVLDNTTAVIYLKDTEGRY
ncbi:MAG: hypothetical protein C4294_08695, partial [Nitrospiraceae bacterium]